MTLVQKLEKQVNITTSESVRTGLSHVLEDGELSVCADENIDGRHETDQAGKTSFCNWSDQSALHIELT